MSDLIHDDLTGLMTPFFFYESANRVISWARRRNQPISLISINLEGISNDDLVRCARELSNELRGGDLLARMAEEKFILLLLGDLTGANQLIFRLSNRIKPRLKYLSTELEANEAMTIAMSRINV